MTRALYRLGRSAATHPWRVIGAWVLLAVAVVALNRAVGGETSDNFRLPGTESQQAVDLLNDRFPAQAGASGQVVFHTTDGALATGPARAAVDATVAQLRATENVVAATDPFDPAAPSVSADGRTAFTTVTLATENPRPADAEHVKAVAEAGRAQASRWRSAARSPGPPTRSRAVRRSAWPWP